VGARRKPNECERKLQKPANRETGVQKAERQMEVGKTALLQGRDRFARDGDVPSAREDLIMLVQWGGEFTKGTGKETLKRIAAIPFLRMEGKKRKKKAYILEERVRGKNRVENRLGMKT